MEARLGFIIVLAAVAIVALAVARGPPGPRDVLRTLVDGTGETHVEIKKHRMKAIIVIGCILAFVCIVAAISVGPTRCMDPFRSIAALFTGALFGVDTDAEMLVIYDRMPRTVSAFAVGMGLAVAGTMYQAVIRNPLCDPYIMGISSGAGFTAVAALAFNFTLFGLLSPQSPYTTAVLAIVGGLVAAAATLALAERAGGTTNAYVLSGVVVGLVFAALQTVLIVFSGDKLSNALLWLFGSFANATWEKAAVTLAAVLVICIPPMRWAKELNLVLLGEDQARQMGLNVHRFSIIVLAVASVLTSVCVAFCGIIGFVGLVVPHLCRMLFGGDHRLLLPASMAVGGSLMIVADIASRILDPGVELPVGAITTLIGVPVFAYLLIKKGKIYNG